jgi:hypothetical protein
MLDYVAVGKRLAAALARRSAAESAEAKAKAAIKAADGEIAECHAEFESGEASRPLLDAIERKSEADEHQRGPTTTFPKSKSKTKVDGAVRTVVIGGVKSSPDPPDRKVRPKGDDAATIERMARERQ